MALRADRGEEGQRQGTRSDPGLEDAGTREEVALLDNLAGVLGVDRGGAAWHGEHVVGHQRAQGLEHVAGLGLEDRSLRFADELPVAEIAALGLEVAVVGEERGVLAALGVCELDALASAERAAAAVGAERMWIGTHWIHLTENCRRQSLRLGA